MGREVTSTRGHGGATAVLGQLGWEGTGGRDQQTALVPDWLAVLLSCLSPPQG